jgi:CHAT domain-containing protein
MREWRMAVAIWSLTKLLAPLPAVAGSDFPTLSLAFPKLSTVELEAVASKAYNEGRWTDAEVAYRAAIARIDPAADSTAIAVLRLYNRLGVALGTQRKVEHSIAAFAVAAERCHSDSECVWFRVDFAHQLDVAGRHDRAIKEFRSVLEEGRALSSPDPAAMSDAHTGLALALSGAGQYSEAISEGEAALREALAIPPSGSSTVRAHTRLAVIYLASGRLEDAENIARKGAELASALNRADPEALRIKQILGSIYYSMKRFPEAERFQREVVAAAEAGQPNNSDLNNFRTELGFTLMDAGKPAEAEPIYRLILARDLALHGENNIDVAVSLHNLGDALAAQGKFDEGEMMQRRSLAAHLAIDPQGFETAKAYEDLRSYLAPQNKLAEAEDYTLKALTLKRRLLPPDDTTIIDSLGFLARSVSRSRPGRDGLAYAREARALAEGRLPTEDRADATAAIRRALGSSRLRAGGKNYVYSIAMEAAAFTDEAEGRIDPALAREAFEAAQYLGVSRAGEAMAMTAARTAAGTGPAAALAQRQQALTTDIRSADADLTSALANGNGAAVATARARLLASGAALAATDRQLRTAFPGYADLIAPRPITIAEVQAALKPNEAMIAVVHADFDIHSFTITKSHVVWWRQEKRADEAKALVRKLLCSVDPAGCNETELAADVAETPMEAAGHRRFDRASASQLYQDFVSPAPPPMAGIDTIYTIATGNISDLPFNLVITGKVAAGDDADPALLRDAGYLSDKYALITLPSIAAFRAVRTAGAAGSGTATPFLGYGDPSLAAPAASERGARVATGGFFRAGSKNGLSIADPASLKALPSLPGTRVELGAMAKLFGTATDTLELGNAATETRLRADPRVAGARVLAFATHGLLPGEVSGLDEPGLVLTPPATASAADDGVLAASEAAQLTLRADWVILSACNTASADGAGQTDSLSGLARAFLYAGAGALLASRWRIGDEVTAALTVETLRERLIPGTRRAVALQRAMRTVRTGKRADGTALAGWTIDWAHPAAWGPFALIANGDD